MSIRTIFLLILCLWAGEWVLAQQQQIPFQRDIYYDVDRNGTKLGSQMHTGMRPVLESWADTTNVLGYRADSSVHYYMITQKLFKERWIEIKGKDFNLTADPAIYFELGYDFRDNSEFADTTQYYVNTRGVTFGGDLGSKVSFQTTFYENQSIFPQYIFQRTKGLGGVVPGQGRAKDFKGRAFDHGWANGYVSYTATKWMNLQVGHGKHFVGNGYRSLLLSDAAFNYPYLKGSFWLWNGKVQYTTIFAKLQVLQRLQTGGSSESLFYWKRATFDHLSINLGKRVQLGIFEGTVWRTLDSAEARPFNAMNYNPVMGINTAVNGFSDEHKQILGADLKIHVRNGLVVYGQVAIDDPSRQKYGWQAGFNLFDLPVKELHLQVEYNTVMPYTYTNQPIQMNYGHYNEPLAHPYGAYFDELVAIMDYRMKRWTFSLKYDLANYNLDPSEEVDLGSDVFGMDEPVANKEGEVQRKQLHFLDGRVSYLMNQYSNMRVSAGYMYRDISSSAPFVQTGYLYLAWHCSLFNKYYDF